MRWITVLAASVVLVVTTAPFATAQEVPVTVTLESMPPIACVSFFDHTGKQIGEEVCRPEDGGDAVQTYVGNLQLNGSTNRYDMSAQVQLGGSSSAEPGERPKPKKDKEERYAFSFGPVDECPAATKNKALRIACSAVKHGSTLVCAAVYETPDSFGEPMKSTCGSHACEYCGRIKVCGSDPQCP